MLCPDADINTVDVKGRTPLFLASWLGYTKVVEALLNNKKIDVNKGNFVDGNTPFSIASIKGHFAVMEKLINHNKIQEGKGWSIDNWAHHITRSKVKPEPTATPTRIGTTARRG